MRLTQKQYAKRAKVTPQYINKLVRQGKIPLGKDGKIDPRKADRARAAHASPMAQAAKKKPKAAKRENAPRSSATQSLTQARAVRENYQARSAKLDYEQRAGTLLPKAEVLEAERRKNAHLRARFRRIGRPAAAQAKAKGLIAAGRSPAEFEEIVLAEVDAVLKDLAVDPLGFGEVVAPPAELAQTPAGVSA